MRIWLLILLALLWVTCALPVACGDDDDNDDSQPIYTPAEDDDDAVYDDGNHDDDAADDDTADDDSDDDQGCNDESLFDDLISDCVDFWMECGQEELDSLDKCEGIFCLYEMIFESGSIDLDCLQEVFSQIYDCTSTDCKNESWEACVDQLSSGFADCVG